MWSRSQGTPWNWKTCVSSWAQIQRSNASALDAQLAHRAAQVRCHEQQARPPVAAPAATLVLAEHALRDVAQHEAQPRRPPSPPRRLAARPPAGRRTTSRWSSRSATGSRSSASDVEVGRCPLGSAHQLRRTARAPRARAACTRAPGLELGAHCGEVRRPGAGPRPLPRRGPPPAGRATSRPSLPKATAPAASAAARAPARTGRRARSTRVEHVVGRRSASAAGIASSSSQAAAWTRSGARARAASRRDTVVLCSSFWLQSISTLPLRSSFFWLDTISSGCSPSRWRASAVRERLRVVVGRLGAVERHVDLEALRAGGLREATRARGSTAPRAAARATSQHSAMPAGGPGSRSKAITVGRSMSAASDSEGCSSRSARLAIQTSVGRSSQRQKSIVLRPVGDRRGAAPSRAGARGTASRRSTGPSTPSG